MNEFFGGIKDSINKLIDAVKEFLEVVESRQELIQTAFVEHLWLSFIAISIACLISLPLGIWIARVKKIAEPMIGVTAILQTIPSLALFGFLVPMIGIGTNTALIALTIYALLPIVRNTYTGISRVDSSMIEAASAMGMTTSQRLWRVEFPLALPFIMAGIRTATVLTVGVATLATFVGAGGLGDVIYRGLQSYNQHLILAGAIPVAILAILFDLVLKFFEKRSTPKGMQIK
ncbi:glycine/betaine ABC transporter [Halalkalibacillus sediminis]|uniref:Glycine/betaine ABC transporter n=1 Tax=Halalkalibacillus sediminis TaxID=2018042 RepID=A0A2I0QSE3_9BACI|nr:ABC transporter permease [Halalkalibacillus sediminis]PKR77257.1 glycine/betaine ABC transporter [Halalkalibacillus sediminis]